ncbi:hypothetical protein ACLMJK_005734 [Lecanora helva]
MAEKHPLQRLQSPAIHGFSPILHLLGLSSFIYSFKWLSDNPNPINESYGWHFQYLTILGLTVATLAFTCGLLADLTSSTTLFYIKNMLSICATPLEVLISILYWSLRIYDRNLVIPEWAQLPFQADISFHAVPSLVLTLDLLFLSPPWTISTIGAMGLSTFLAFSYWFFVEQCFQHNGFYPYPIFEMVGTSGRIGLFTMSAVIMTGSTVALKVVYAKVNGKVEEGGKGEALDEGSVSEQIDAYTKEAKYIAQSQGGPRGGGDKQDQKPMDESSVKEQAAAYAKEANYIAKSQT